MNISYDDFKNEIIKSVNDFLEHNYPDVKLVCGKNYKTNVELDSMTVVIPDKNISPVIYVNYLYDDYCNGGILADTVNKALDNVKDMIEEKSLPDIDMSIIEHINDFEAVRDKIIFQLINTEENSKMLKNVPHRDFNDLSVVYRIVIDVNVNETASILINDKILKNYDINEAELYDVAYNNTQQKSPIEISSLVDIFKRMPEFENTPDIKDICDLEIPAEHQMWIISNSRREYGAAAIIYQDKLRELSEKLDSNLYILPSSVHECIAVSDKFFDVNELKQMVQEVNISEVSESERLSNNVYKYDRSLNKVLQVTNSNKALKNNNVNIENNMKRKGRSR